MVRARVVAFLGLLLIAIRGVVGCSSDPAHLEPVGTTQEALITPSSANSPVAFTANHETSVAYLTGGGSDPAPGHWVMATNNWDTTTCVNVQNCTGCVGTCAGTPLTCCSLKWLSWAYSTDGNGNSWTFANESGPTQWGCPGGACPGTSAPSEGPSGSSFNGWRGDPSVAAITNPSLNNNGQRVVVTMLASSVNTDGGDVVVALSENGGQTWGNLQWVTTSPANGGIADMPFVFSNPNPPWDTYVSWQNVKNNVATGFLRQISYSAGGTFIGGSVITIPKASNDKGSAVNRFNFGFGTLPGGCTSGQEGIFLVYTNGFSGRCSQGGTREDNGTTYWNFGIFDTGNSAWYGPTNYRTDSNFSRCVGSPLTVAYTNDSDPHIAVDPTNSRVWVTHTRQTSATGPVRTYVESALIGCPIQNPFTFDTVFTAPDPCAGCSSDDNWLPAIAMHRSGANPRVGVYWYSTMDASNSQATLFASFQENLGPFSPPIPVATTPFPIGGTSSWAVGGIDPNDYQTLGTSWQNSSFLNLWANDRRSAQLMGWNGGFETGALTADGASGTDWSGSGSSYGVTNADHHSGNYCARTGDVNPTTNSTLKQTFTAPQNAVRMSVWYKMGCGGSSCPDSLAWDYATATLWDNTNNMSAGTLLPPTYNLGTWTQTSPVFVTPGHSYTITLTNHDDNSGGDASYTYWDDLSFSTLTTSTMMSSLAK